MDINILTHKYTNLTYLQCKTKDEIPRITYVFLKIRT